MYSYNGSGRIPPNLGGGSDPEKRILLEQLPRLLQGYGKAFVGYPDNYPAAVILVCDLDRKSLETFRQELIATLNTCNPKPETRFCIAIEEGEAWFLGDIPAIKAAYPKAKDTILNAYKNDAICGTWERLADAVFPGGSQSLSKKGWAAVGAEKSVWAEKITPHMDVTNNLSPSFRYFKSKLQELAELDAG